MAPAEASSLPASSMLEQFLQSWGPEILVGQVLIERREPGFLLRHAEDRHLAPELLKPLPLEDLREWVQFTAEGSFRPLRSAPNLRPGWVVRAETPAALGRSLDLLYPGFLPDWKAARQEPAPVTHYRAFTRRQTGMYRITTHLDDAQAARAIRSTCDARFCLKRRLWTVEGLPADGPGEKSLIPCLEPCAILLEFARRAARLEQQPEASLGLSEGELDSLCRLLQAALEAPRSRTREADFEDPENPRRLQWLLEKLQAARRALNPAASP